MSLRLCLLACFLACLQPIYTASAPYVTKCSATDSKCIKSSAQAFLPIFANGIPELGVKKMDPLFIKHLDGSSSDLSLKLDDVTATGLSQCIVKKMQLNADKTKLTVKLLCTVDATGKYEMKGKLLVLPIEGKGDAHVVLRKVVISVDIDIKEVTGTDGLPHWSIGKWKHSYELKEKATVELDNLFNGSELLGRATKELLANSPNEVVTAVGPSIIKGVAAEIIDSVNNCFSKIPVSELVL